MFNPVSGKGQVGNNLLEIIDCFVKNGYEVTVHPTQGPQDAKEVVSGMSGQYQLVVCCGGDGTLNETVSGMMERKKKVPVGYIPSGSTNDFAISLQIPDQVALAARTAVCGRKARCDVGMFNGRCFVYIAAFGLFTDVSYETSQELKNRIGHMAYLLEGIKRLQGVQPCRIRLEYGEGESVEGDFIYGMITNSISAGGFKHITGKHVKLDDGLFEVMLVRMPKNPNELNEIIACLANRIDDSELVEMFKTDSLRLKADREIRWTLDGEYGGSYEEVEIQNERRAIQMMVG